MRQFSHLFSPLTWHTIVILGLIFYLLCVKPQAMCSGLILKLLEGARTCACDVSSSVSQQQSNLDNQRKTKVIHKISLFFTSCKRILLTKKAKHAITGYHKQQSFTKAKSTLPGVSCRVSVR